MTTNADLNPVSTNKRRIPFALSVAGWIAVLFAGMFAGVRIGGGDFTITSGEILRWLVGADINEQHATVLRVLRVPRVCMAVVAGAALSVSGVVYQALLRNPLAGPYTLGVSGGATFGAVLAIFIAGAVGSGSGTLTLPLLSTSALLGAGISIGLIYLIALSSRRFSSGTIVLAGVTLNLIFGSLILLLQYLADFTQVYQMIRWMMGGLDVDYRDLWVVAPAAALGMGVVFFSMRELDLLAVDPLTAATLGVRVESVRWRLLLIVSLMIGCIVAFTGPIGFVGLIVPHSIRMVTGASHRRVLPASIIVGGLFLMACDTLAQNILGDEEIPVGVITAMLGGPFFVFLLLRGRGSGVWTE